MKFLEDNNNIYTKSKINILGLKKIYGSRFGKNSSIYNYNDDLLKVFKIRYPIEIYQELGILSDLNTKSMVKIIKYLWINNKFYGYSMPYIKGNMFSNLDKDIDLRKLLISLIPVEKDLIMLANNKFIADDLNILNLLYSKSSNTTKLIDLESYYRIDDYSSDNIRCQNLLKLYRIFLLSVSDIYNIDSKTPDIYLYFNELLYTNDYYSANIKEYFISLIEILECEVDKEINTISDFRKALKLSNKND